MSRPRRSAGDWVRLSLVAVQHRAPAEVGCGEASTGCGLRLSCQLAVATTSMMDAVFVQWFAVVGCVRCGCALFVNVQFNYWHQAEAS